MAGEPAQIGPYRIGKRIGQGGMGAVYEAVHETIGRRAAVKYLNAPLARNPATLNRFFNEARAVSVVEHPGLVQIYDSGQLPDGPAYIIMELIRGETLADRLKREKRLPVLHALRLGWQLADTLAAVHEKDIVHRDIKPANLMIVPDPAATGRERLKVLDFGIAKLASGIGAGATRPGQVMGSPVYMAPEQCRGAAGVDSKADVYAAGAVLYHMLAGHPPFDGETFAALVFKHLHEPVVPLSDLGVQAPAALLDCVHSLLQKDPKLRPTTAEAASRLESLLAEAEKESATRNEEPTRPSPPPAHVAENSNDATRLFGDFMSTLGHSVGQSRITHWPPSRGVLGAVTAGVLAFLLLLALLLRDGTPDPKVATQVASTPSGDRSVAVDAAAQPHAEPSAAVASTHAAFGSAATTAASDKPMAAGKPRQAAHTSSPATKTSSAKATSSPSGKRRAPPSKGSKSLGARKPSR